MKESGIGLMIFAVGLLILCTAVAAPLTLYQPFKVWMAGYTVKVERLRGEAEFVRAEQNRKILVEQARAEMDAAELRASAISIVGQAAKDFPEYRQQEFIGAFGEAVKNGDIDQIIYVATEIGIPITEANRLAGE
jgi:hypothetical protein